MQPGSVEGGAVVRGGAGPVAWLFRRGPRSTGQRAQRRRRCQCLGLVALGVASVGAPWRASAQGPALAGAVGGLRMAPASSRGALPPEASIGSISVAHPHEGYLVNGVQMPPGPLWIRAIPELCWGTQETVDALAHVITRVKELMPDLPKVVIGAIGAEHGGPLLPHKSHRAGRDADVSFVFRGVQPLGYLRATADNLDRAHTWMLLRTFITDTDLDFVLIDQGVQALLEEYALGIGEDPAWIQELFHGKDRYEGSLVKHVPGHTGHMHLRFVSPASRRRGLLAYDRLVEQGHVPPKRREVAHVVSAGDTLSGIAARFHTSVEEIVALNHLDGSGLQVGQRLVLTEQQDLRGARDPVIVPRRRLPPGSDRAESLATRAVLGSLLQEVVPLAK